MQAEHAEALLIVPLKSIPMGLLWPWDLAQSGKVDLQVGLQLQVNLMPLDSNCEGVPRLPHREYQITKFCRYRRQ